MTSSVTRWIDIWFKALVTRMSQQPALQLNVALLSLSVSCFLAFAVILRVLGVGGKSFDLALYVVTVTLAPLVAAWTCRRLRPSDAIAPVHGRSSNVLLVALLLLLLLPVFFFDFSLAVEPLHYMTIIGPAVHMLNGGRLFIDTFSQYGPGPVLLTLTSFAFLPASFGTANIAIQILNLAYFALFLAYLYRFSRPRAAGLLLGFLSLCFLLAAWGHGESNVNIAPSIGGQRYLLTFMMVFAIALLRPPSRHSWSTVTIGALSAAWSAETLLATLAVQCTFLVALAFRDRAWGRAAVDVLYALAPAVVVIGMLSLAMLVYAGTLPRLDIYLEYFSKYNPLSDYWARPRQSFYGWVPMLAVMLLALGHAWHRIFIGATDTGAQTIFYRVLPMTVLLLWAALYFVGRSIDYTLLLAFLPFMAIVIPQGLDLLRTRARPAVLVAGLAATIYGCLVAWPLFGTKPAYAFYLQQCRDRGYCGPAELAEVLRAAIAARPALEPVGNPWSDYRLDHDGVLPDAVNLIERYAMQPGKLTVLLGRVQYVTYLSDLAQLYTGHWHRFPISFTFTDDLVPKLAQRIVEAPIRLSEGELVIVRRDEATLEGLEKELLARLRAEYRLCEIANDRRQVTAYRVTLQESCQPT